MALVSNFTKFQKVFSDEENSYIYEEICRNMINEALKKQCFCTLAYGFNLSGKKSSIFGLEDSMTNINSTGLQIQSKFSPDFVFFALMK